MRRTAVLAAALSTCISAGALPAAAGHGPEAPGGPYEGYSSATALHVDALTNDAARLVDVEIGTADAAVDSEGLEKVVSEHTRVIVPGGHREHHAAASASVAELGLGLQPPEAENQLKPFSIETFAPGGEPQEQSLTNQTVASLVHFSVARRAVEANWNSSTCVVGEPIAVGEEHLARVELLETGDDGNTPTAAGFDAPVLGIDADDPRRAASHVRAIQQLFRGKGEGLGLQSVVTSTLAPVTLLQGTPNEFSIEVDGLASLSVVADGTSGGARATYDAPLVRVVQGETERLVLPSSPVEITVPPSGGEVLARIQLGTIAPLPDPKGLGDETALGNGTFAAAQAHVVEVDLFEIASLGAKAATVALGHMEASARVPEGGISCPIPVRKDADPDEVTVGDQFTTTITVHNPFRCPLTNVRVEDRITTEQGALFEVVDTAPRADAEPDGANRSSGTVVWEDIGTIQPGKSKSVAVTLQAQGAAGRIADVAEASGTLANCPASPGGDDVSALANARVPVAGRARLEVPASRVLGARLPATGLPLPQAAAGIGLTVSAAALVTAIRTRRPRR